VLKHGQDSSEHFRFYANRVPKKKVSAGTTIRKPAARGAALSYMIRCVGVVASVSRARLDGCERRSKVRRKS